MSTKIYVKYVKNNIDFHTTKLNLPTGNLDSKNSQEVLALLQTMSAKYQQTILMITHNKNHASAADRIFNMSDGVLKELGASRK